MKRNCKKGYSCGKTCISLLKACRKTFPDGVSVALEDRSLVRSYPVSFKKPDFPKSLQSLKVVKKLGGSTGAQLVEDPDTGKRYVLKRGNSPEHVREEFAADEAYRAMGVPVPKGKLYEENGKPVKLTEFIEGKSLFELSSQERGKAEKELAKNFVLDAVLSNWDVTGMSGDNILVSNDGTVYRIDNGGSLRYRAQGAPKGSAFGEKVIEIETLRDKNLNKTAATAFSSLTDKEIEKQKKDLLGKKDVLLKSLPVEVRDLVSKRLDSLNGSRATTLSKSMDPLGLEEGGGIGSMDSGKKEAVSKILRDKGIMPPGEIEKTLDSIESFTETGYKSLRIADKEGKRDDERLNLIYKNILNNDKFPAYDGVIYRGMTFGVNPPDIYNLSAGDLFTNDALSSTSSREEISKVFAKPYSEQPHGLLLKIKNNTKGKSIMPLSAFRGEKEVLIPKGVTYKVTNVYMDDSVTKYNNGIKVIELEEV